MKNVLKYLCQTKDCGIIYHKANYDSSLPTRDKEWLSVDKDFPKFLEMDISSTSLVKFVDAAHGTDLHKGRSITGYLFTMSGS